MAKGEKNKAQRVELWLQKSTLRFIANHMTKENESRKQALERIIQTAKEKQHDKVKEMFKV